MKHVTKFIFLSIVYFITSSLLDILCSVPINIIENIIGGLIAGFLLTLFDYLEKKFKNKKSNK